MPSHRSVAPLVAAFAAVATLGSAPVARAADQAVTWQIDAAHDGQLDLVVTDVVMPRMGGPDLVRQLALVRPIVDLGRSVDFLPRPLPAELGRRFGLLHTAFLATDLAKAVLLAAAAVALGRR